MKTSHLLLPGVAALAALTACATGEVIAQSSSPASGRPRPCLHPRPVAPTVNIAPAEGWPEGAMRARRRAFA